MEEENTKEKPVKKLGNLTLDILKLIDSHQEIKENNQSEKFAESMKFNDAAMQHHSESMKMNDAGMQHHLVNEFRLSDALETKTIKPLDLKTLSLSFEEIKKLSNEDLLKLLSGEGHDGHILDRTVQLISNEILIRQIKEASKPHWTVKPAFFLLVVTLILTAIPAAETIYDLAFKNTGSIDSHTNKGNEIKSDSKP